MGELKLPSAAISMLVRIKRELLKDNSAALKIAGSGCLTVAHYIDDLISNTLLIDTSRTSLQYDLQSCRCTLQEYENLFSGVAIEYMSEEALDQIRAIAKAEKERIEKEDEAD